MKFEIMWPICQVAETTLAIHARNMYTEIGLELNRQLGPIQKKLVIPSLVTEIMKAPTASADPADFLIGLIILAL
jgi:hypothetical protein